MPTISMLGFQDGVSHMMIECIFFHDVVMVVLLLISIMVGGVLFSFPNNSFPVVAPLEGQLLEWIWTLIPGLVLVFIALPSISLLYMYDELVNFEFSVKCLGHQWFWSYEYPGAGFLNKSNINFDSYMKPSSEMNQLDFRLLDTDLSLMIPMWTMVQVLISSEDVLHAWTIPSLGVKVDAIPGRVNNLLINCSRPGVYYGQCSEICGAYHSFMPIKLEVIGPSDFIKWLIL